MHTVIKSVSELFACFWGKNGQLHDYHFTMIDSTVSSCFSKLKKERNVMLAVSQLLYEPPPKKDSSSGFHYVEKGYNTPVPGGHADPFSHRAQSGPGPHLLTLDFFFFYSQAQASSVVGFHLT